MKALIVIALFVTVNSVRAEDASAAHLAAVAAAGAVNQTRISPDTVRAEKVSQCIEERLNLAKGRSKGSVSSSVSPSTSGY